jgi:hypothetical protein
MGIRKAIGFQPGFTRKPPSSLTIKPEFLSPKTGFGLSDFADN